MLSGLLKRFGGRNGSKNAAKKRLQFALIYDRLEVSDNSLAQLQQDIIDVISKYFEIDKDSLKLDIQRDEELSALVVNTPIIAAKHRAQQA